MTNYSAKTNKGFIGIEGVLIVVILALIGLIGYKVYSTKNTTDKLNNQTANIAQQLPEAAISVPSTIKSTADLDKADRALSQYDNDTQDNSDTNQLNSQLSAF